MQFREEPGWLYVLQLRNYAQNFYTENGHFKIAYVVNYTFLL